MILNNIILIIVLLLLANYLSKGTIITIVLKYYEIVKNYIFPFPLKKEEPTCDFHYNNEDTESKNTDSELINTDTENTLKLNTLNLSDSGSISISEMNFSTLV
jgi:hypothetical protein